VEPPLVVCSLEPTADEMRVVFNALPESGRILYLSFRPKGGDDDLFVDIAETGWVGEDGAVCVDQYGEPQLCAEYCLEVGRCAKGSR
jgi:hypothetical protein